MPVSLGIIRHAGAVGLLIFRGSDRIAVTAIENGFKVGVEEDSCIVPFQNGDFWASFKILIFNVEIRIF